MRKIHSLAALAAAVSCCPLSASAAPYVSGITITGTTVSFILNENADSLTLSINGGAPVPLSPTRGLQSFQLGSPSDTFSLSATKIDADGYTRRTGSTIPANMNGLSIEAPTSQLRVLSDPFNPLTRFNSPRGVNVNRNPNAGPLFGTAYISNSAAGSYGGGGAIPGAPRPSIEDGIYALFADQSDRFGFGNTAQTGGITIWGTSPSASAPFRVTVGPDNRLYIADWSDATGTVWRMDGDLSNGINMFPNAGGPTTPPGGPGTRNHGSVVAVHVEGTPEAGNLRLFTIDEDITSAEFGGPPGDDRNSLWRYDIDGNPLPFAGNPTRVNQTRNLLPLAVADLARGADGKFYLAQNRNAGNEPGIFVLSSEGTVLFNSLQASRALLDNPTAPDILRNILGMDVSDDQKWMALILNYSKVAVVPLIDGIPDLANVSVVDTGTNVNSGRDIAFDAAGNIHYVSSGQGIYQVLARGGSTLATTSWNGTSFSFSIGDIPNTPSYVLGDFNFDGGLDGSDVDPFVLALSDLDAYLADFADAFADAYPGMTLDASVVDIIGDFNGDSGFDGSDVDGFIEALSTGRPGTAAIPEPAALGLLAPAALLISRRRR